MVWYKLALRPDGDSWLVASDDFEELVSFGVTQEEACRNGRNAIEEAIAGRIAAGEDIPPPAKEPSNGGRWVQMPAMVFLKAALYMIMKGKGLTRADLMRRLGWHREQADRLFRLDHQSKLESLEAAFEAVGEPLRFDMEFPNAA